MELLQWQIGPNCQGQETTARSQTGTFHENITPEPKDIGMKRLKEQSATGGQEDAWLSELVLGKICHRI